MMQINETNSYTEYTTTEPTTDFVVGFEYFNNKAIDTINITVDGVDANSVGYAITKVNNSVFRLSPSVPTGTVVRLLRETDLDAPVYKFSEGALFRAPNVDTNFKQILHAQQEVRDYSLETRGLVTNTLNEYDKRIDTVEATTAQTVNALAVETKARVQGDLDVRRYAEDLVGMGQFWDGISSRSVWDYNFNMNQADLNVLFNSKTIVSVQEFGAVGNGSTNDTTAFTNLELNYQGRTIDLLGLTYKVDRDFTRNKYINGTLRIGSSNRGKGLISSMGNSFRGGIGNGQRIGELVSPLFDDVVPTSSTIYQTVAYEPAQNRIYTHRVLRGSGETAEIVVDCFDYLAMTITGSTPLFTTASTTYLGHQGMGVTRKSGVTHIWSTCGTIRYAERARFISRSTIDTSTGEFTEQLTYKVFGNEFTGSNTSVMSVSPNQQFLVATATHPTKGRTCRVFDINIFVGTDGTDYSNQYLYEFGFGTISGIGAQSVCTDGNFIYFLHGSGTVRYTNIEVFSMNGAYVSTDTYNTTALYDAQQLSYTYYEPECLFVGDNGRLLQCAAVGKKGGANARDSYTNYIHTLNLHETQVWRTDGGRPLLSMSANRCIAHPNSRPLTLSELGADGVYTDYRSENSSGFNINVAKRHTSEINTSTSDSVQVIYSNSVIRGAVIASQSGLFGFYIPSKSLYPLAYSVSTNQCVMQFTTSIAGDLIPSSNGTRSLGGSTLAWKEVTSKKFSYSATVFDSADAGSPEGVLTAGVGSTYRNTTGGAGSTFYVKESGTGNTGWVAK